jgi:hypothetical protein
MDNFLHSAQSFWLDREFRLWNHPAIPVSFLDIPWLNPLQAGERLAGIHTNFICCREKSEEFYG